MRLLLYVHTMLLGAEEKFLVGEPDEGEENRLINSKDSRAEFEVMFDDDGTTGYFYAIQSGPPLQILDALHVYNVADIADREAAVTAQIFWDETESAAALLINGYCHALFDFKQQAGFCRNAFPPPMRQQQTASRELTDELVDKYFAA